MTPKLTNAALAVFETYPDADVVHVCEDGNVFLDARKQLAEAHCAANRLPKPVPVSRKTAESGLRLMEAVMEAKAEAEQAAADAEAKAEAEQAAADAEEAKAKAKAEAEQAEAEVKVEQSDAAPEPKAVPKPKAKSKKK